MDDDGPKWPKVAAVAALALVASLLALAFMGTQVSRILSTVGASVISGAAPANGGEVAAPEQPGPAAGPDGGGSEPGAGELAGDDPLSLLSRPDMLVIKTGTLSLQVGAIDKALVDAGAIVSSLGGYASASDRTGDADEPHASVTYRIPAAGWETAFNRLRGIAQKVLAEHSSTEDVTGQVVDLGARIANLQATERALQTIMDRASVIEDVLSVQSELTKVRGQIEELSATKVHLEEQSAYSTLEVTFSLKPPDPVRVEQAGFDPGGEVERASATLVGIGQDAATVGIWFGIVWLPILIVLAMVGVEQVVDAICAHAVTLVDAVAAAAAAAEDPRMPRTKTKRTN
jgi:hypothetical protein